MSKDQQALDSFCRFQRRHGGKTLEQIEAALGCVPDDDFNDWMRHGLVRVTAWRRECKLTRQGRRVLGFN